MDLVSIESRRMRPRLGIVISAWSKEDGHEYARTLLDLFGRAVPSQQLEPVVCPQLLESELDIPGIVAFFAGKSLDALCLVPGNFTLDHILPLMAQTMGLPTILWGLPTREAWGALVAIQQTLYPFKELGLPYRFVVGELGDAHAWEKVAAYARGAALVQRLKGLRVGLMGWRAQGMSDVVFDELALREVFGVQVVNVGLTRYERALAGVPETRIDSAWQQIRQKYEQGDTPDEVARYGVRSYLALKHLIGQESLAAVTVECFHDHLGGPCLGCSLCGDEGLPAACEADVPGAILMAAGQLLSGEPTFHADIITADLASNSAVVFHCGNLPWALADRSEPPRLSPMITQMPGAYGPTVQATMAPGPVTMLNLVGRRGTLRMCALEGDVVSYRLEFPGSAACVKFAYSLAEALETVGNAGQGHHFVLLRGHWAREAGEWCRLLGIDYLQKTA